MDEKIAKIGICGAVDKIMRKSMREAINELFNQKPEKLKAPETFLDAYAECLDKIKTIPCCKIGMNARTFEILSQSHYGYIDTDMLYITDAIPDFKCALLDASNLWAFPTIETPAKNELNARFGLSREEMTKYRRRYTKKKYKYKKKSKRRRK